MFFFKLMMERRKEKLCDCILGMFYLSLKTGKTYSSAPQIYQTLFDGTKKKTCQNQLAYIYLTKVCRLY